MEKESDLTDFVIDNGAEIDFVTFLKNCVN